MLGIRIMKNYKVRPSKNSHTTKSKQEKDSYGNFLNRSSAEIDDTFSDEKENTKFSNTIKDVSSLKGTKKIDGDERDFKNKEKPYKSLSTKIIENIKSIVFASIVSVIITVCVGIVWQQQREIGEISATIKSVQTDISGIQEKYQNTVDGKVDVVRVMTEMSKDLEFIKIRLQKIENRIGI